MKPVAYCVSKDNHIECLCFNEGYAQKHANRCENAQVTPLYTHPAKTLTDEEIIEEIADMYGQMINTSVETGDLIWFAKAILRKAQEK